MLFLVPQANYLKKISLILFSLVNPNAPGLNHCLNYLLPVAKCNKYRLRDIGHGLLIDRVTSELHKRTFINRILFGNYY